MGGGMEDGGATALVNCGVDSPLSGASNESRPMWALIAENDECLSAYHAAYDKLLKEYFESGEFEKQFDKLVGMIRPFVKKDPSAFYTAEEFEAGVDMLKSFCLKRAESIRLQIDGKLAAVTGEQNEADRVDASDIDISAMGTHGGPGNHIGQEGHDHGGPGQGIPDGQGRGFPDGRDFPGEAEDSAAPSA